MEQRELFEFMWKEYKRQRMTRAQWEKKAGVSVTNVRQVLSGYKVSIGIEYVMKMLDALDLQLVVEDKDANWGEEMARLRMMPKKLYIAERIESREMVKKEGFYPRVDLFDNIDSVLKFVPKPCDVYEIYIGKLIRKKFDVIEHPYGTMYSYNEWIEPGYIKNMTTYR